MVVNTKEKRIERLVHDIRKGRYSERTPLSVEFTVDKEPIPLEDIPKRNFEELTLDRQWGDLWDSAWFRFRGQVPENFKGQNVVALIDLGAEGCVFKDGSPYAGITYKRDGETFERKRRVPLLKSAAGGEAVDLLVEAAANGLFGECPPWDKAWPFFRLNQAELAVFHPDVWQLSMDMDFLLQLYKSLDPDLPRAKKILHGLNAIANLTPLSENISEARAISQALIHIPASRSEMTVWSVGHAHLDLGWLWRFRETKRKGGRTFATALRMIDEYPDYVFGASQPQLFEWMKEEYPKMYRDIRIAVADGRIECQGGMWVEPDMNVTGGESLVRQCLYGKTFFKEEFGKDINHLWLPDVFGYSAALPQILKKTGMDYFITQKISWNESNTFPHHTFVWKGIDGSGVVSHFLPANNYNCENTPSQMMEASRRFAQSDVHDGFLNLFGIGDGGGGPSRRHIEFGRRAADCEAMPKVKMAAAGEFLKYLESQGTEDLPVWVGELYLELHRGTYTTQAMMKKYNRRLEHQLRDVEFMSAIVSLQNGKTADKSVLDRIWKDTLLNQFHDVLPGSSINEVYRDAHEMSRSSLEKLSGLETELIEQLLPEADNRATTLINTQPWTRREILSLNDGDVMVAVPSLGIQTLEDSRVESEGELNLMDTGENSVLENDSIRVVFGSEGSILSMYHKNSDSEMFTCDGGGEFLLFEDKPYFWDAWDVSDYYTETKPEKARLLGRKILHRTDLIVRIEQTYSIGCSEIVQVVELRQGESLVRSHCRVNWKEDDKMLRLRAHPNLINPTASYEIQYGTVERPTHSNTSWDAARFEVCGHRFADLSQPDRGLALINDCKYGYRIQNGLMELNLLRSPSYPDPVADRGKHEFSWAYMAHSGNLQSGGVLQAAHNFNSPLRVAKGRRPSNGCLCSSFRVDTDSVKIETIKPSESGSGVVLRMYEVQGGNAFCKLEIPSGIENAFETDMLEQIEKETPILTEGAVELEFSPFEIKTLLFNK